MMKRATWFTAGAITGVVVTRMAKKKVMAAAAELSPANLAHKAVIRARESAIEHAEVLKSRASELRARLAAHPVVAGEVIELHRRHA